jgi:hypothetical protein
MQIIRLYSLFAIGLMVLLVGLSGCDAGDKSSDESPKDALPVDTSAFFSISVNFGDSTEVYSEIPYVPEMTVYQALEAARDLGPFAFQDSTFAGMGKFITGINGVKQQPAEKKYWTVCLDGVTAIEGVEDLTFEAGQEIQWYYGEESPCKGFGE